MNVELTPIIWLGDSIATVREWSFAARRRIGEELFRLQLGGEPLNWRVVKSVGRGVREIKVSEGRQFRVFYVTQRKDSIVVLHAFEKKSQKTRKADLTTAGKRLKELEQIRSSNKEI